MSEPPPVPSAVEEDEKPLNHTDIDLAASTENLHVSTSEKKNQEEPGADLFFSTISDPEPPQDQTKNVEDMDELFKMNTPASPKPAPATKEIKLDDDEDDPFSLESKPAKVETEQPKQPAINIQPVISTQKSTELPELSTAATPEKSPIPSLNTQQSNSNVAAYTIEEDEEDRDKFIEITLSDPTKVGDGMGSYMVYRITTKTNWPIFKNKEFSSTRRFSDFLNLYEKLKEKHLPAGRILPPAPEKDMIGMAKVKMSKEDAPNEFIERRRAALQRFLNRLAQHKTFRFDPDFRDFLEISDDLPKASNTSALSGAGMLKMFKNVTDSVTKIAIKMDETDQWFEEKSRQIDNLYIQFKKMHSMVELLYGWRKDLATSTKEFSKSCAILANSEEQLNLSRALSQLGEIYEKIDQIYIDQSNSDFFVFSELIKDYVSLFDNIKEVFYQRIKLFSQWQKNEELLRSKREAKAKLEAANKQDKIPTVAAEIRDLEAKVEKSKDDFEQISKSIKEEIKRFDFNRINEFKTELTKYLKTLLTNQETLVKIWEQYLPQVKSI